jgi:hypothetical protein
MVNEGMDVLGRHIQNGGISIAKAKIDAFVALRSPTSFQESKSQLPMSTVYHAETDGVSERSNKILVEALRYYVDVRQSNWAEQLTHVEIVMNPPQG